MLQRAAPYLPPAAVLAALLATSAPAVARQGVPVSEIPLEKLGRAFVDRYWGEDADPAACELTTFLDEHCARARIGVYDLRWPLEDAERLERKPKKEDVDPREVIAALLDQQDVWVRWVGSGEAAERARADMALLRDWAEDLDTRTFARMRDGDERELFAAAQAPQEVLDARDRLATFMATKEQVGLVPYEDLAVQILCAPDRRLFMELVGYVGLHDEANQSLYWLDGVDQWTQIWSDFTLLLCLQYAPWSYYSPDFDRGMSMKKFEDTGLAEHVVQQATLAHMRYCMVHREQSHLEIAMALNIVIEVCGQINTIDAEGQLQSSGASTRPYERFVPGGNPNGGTLPPMSAAPLNLLVDNPWRTGHGEDHFSRTLRRGQKAGAKRFKKESKERKIDESAHFLIASSSGGGQYVVSAPFFGSHAHEKEYPPYEFLRDYREMFRAYKCGFFHWLRTEGAGEDSEEAYRTLLRRMGDLGADDSFEALVEEVYGLPISGADSATDSLEWRYLHWLEEA